MFVRIAQPIIILIVNGLSIEATQSNIISGEVETTNARKGQDLLHAHTHTHTPMHARKTHLAAQGARYYFSKGRTPIVGIGPGHRDLYIYG